MNQEQFNETIRKRIREFWAARGRTVGPGGVDFRWPCGTVELRRSQAPLHGRVDGAPENLIESSVLVIG
jgi:hypothetical protein